MHIRLSDEATAEFGLSAQEEVGAADAFSRIACILTIPLSTCESLEAGREATPVIRDSGRYWLYGAAQRRKT
jgi:hypothetical protein